MADDPIPFNRPHTVGTELDFVSEAMEFGQLSGNGELTRRCSAWLEERLGSARVLLTHSCTGALEMGALLAEVGPGDEVVMPSFTFPSTANAFVLRGATPVFVDVREDTLNLDTAHLEEAIGPRTRAIVPVHYSGVGCDMDAIVEIADSAGVVIIEDAAQAIFSTYRGQALGAVGDLGALSFHETKTLSSGEGGALLVNDPDLIDRAEILLEKGTDRARFFRGEIDKYTWQDVGSSFLMSEVTAAFLYAQLLAAEEIVSGRLATWERYHEGLAPLEESGLIRRPTVPGDCTHNGQSYWLLLPTPAGRDALIASLNARGIAAIFHYLPLHASPAGRRWGRPGGDLGRTENLAGRLIRLPLWVGMPDAYVDRVVETIAADLAP